MVDEKEDEEEDEEEEEEKPRFIHRQMDSRGRSVDSPFVFRKMLGLKFFAHDLRPGYVSEVDLRREGKLNLRQLTLLEENSGITEAVVWCISLPVGKVAGRTVLGRLRPTAPTLSISYDISSFSGPKAALLGMDAWKNGKKLVTTSARVSIAGDGIGDFEVKDSPQDRAI